MIHRIGIIIFENKLSLFELKENSLEKISYVGDFIVKLNAENHQLLEIITWLKDKLEISEEDSIDLLILSDHKERFKKIKKEFDMYASVETKFLKAQLLNIITTEIEDGIISLIYPDHDTIFLKKTNAKVTLIEANENKKIKEHRFYLKCCNDLFQELKKINYEKISEIEEVQDGSFKEYCKIKTVEYGR